MGDDQLFVAASYTYIAKGEVRAVGGALAREILFLADTLNASEDLCASYVTYATRHRPSRGGGGAENGLLLYLDERGCMLRCLHAIWRGALEEARLDSPLQAILKKETIELTQGRGVDLVLDSSTNAKGSWVHKVVATIDSLKSLTDSLRSSISHPSASTALTTANHGARFNDETTEMRVQRHEEERHALAQLLFLIGTAGQASSSVLTLVTRQLSGLAHTDGATVYVLVALLAALDYSSSSANDDAPQPLCPLLSDPHFVNQINQTLAARWAVPKLKAVVQLQWSVFLEAASRVSPNFEADGGEQIETLTWEAVEGGAFAFLGKAVLAFKRDTELDQVWGGIGREVEELGGGNSVEGWFQPFVTDQVASLIVEVISGRFAVLRKLRNREEDVLSTSHRGGGHRLSRGGLDERPIEARHVLESLFLLIATVYRGVPDGGLPFWEDTAPDPSSSSAYNHVTGRLSAFLRWGSECRPPGMVRAYYEMVAALASGPQSAGYAFQFLSGRSASDPSSGFQGPASSSFSWANLFGALEFYVTNLPDRAVEAGPNAEGALGEMPPEEVPLLRSFVRLLRQVVTFSDVARATLYDNQRHRPVAILFDLLGRPIPIELKASLLSAIAAFSRPGGPFGVDVARRTWATLEQSQILPTLAVSEGRDARGGAGVGLAGRGAVLRGPGPLSIAGGIYTELEEVETPNKVYPESTAFVELLNTLIHTPSSLEPIRRGVDFDTQTVPDNLGAPHRAPGIDPYVRFVLDDVLLKTVVREFADIRERWNVSEMCVFAFPRIPSSPWLTFLSSSGLAFVEKCLASYDLGPFLASAAVGVQRTASGPTSPLSHLVIHPGFDILTRLLSGGELLEYIFTILIAGYDAIAQNLAGTPAFTQCMLRCLRILRRTLELQTPFLEIVLPSLGASTVPIPPDKLARLRTLAPIDQSFLFHSEAVVQLALLVACREEDEISLLAVQILAVLATSPFFDVVQKFPEQSRGKLNRLVGLLEASPETLRIMEAFVSRVDEDVPESDLETGEWDGPEGEAGDIRQAIKSAILDLLLQNTQADRPGPNIAHLLLGFNIHGRPSEMEIDDPDAGGTQRTTLHIILRMLAQNVPGSDDDHV